MLVETWVAAIFIVIFGVAFLLAILSSMISDERNENLHKQIEELQNENAELKHYIAVQKTKRIIGVANDFYNEGEKK